MTMLFCILPGVQKKKKVEQESFGCGPLTLIGTVTSSGGEESRSWSCLRLHSCWASQALGDVHFWVGSPLPGERCCPICDPD